MTSASALADNVALLLFQNIMEGMETGRITNLGGVQTEVEAAIAELGRRRLPEGPTHINDLVGQMLVEVGSLHEKVVKCETQLAEFHSQAEALKEETTQIVTRTEACNLLVEQQQKENAKVLAAMEGMKANITTTPLPCRAPAPSPVESTSHPAPSRMAVVSFPGGPRTITIHPPSSPNYQSVIRDDKGDIIISLRSSKPLRREGAFRGPVEDINWHEIHRVHGCELEFTTVPRSAPPAPRWPDCSHPASNAAPARVSSDIIARQRQLSTCIQTDMFGRILPAEHLAYAKSPSLPTGISSSQPSQDLPSSSNAKGDAVSTPCSTPPSPSVGRSKKRARNGDEEEVLTCLGAREEALLLTDSRGVQEPTTPKPVKLEESHLPEGPVKRKKARLSAEYSVLDLTRAV